MKDDVPALESTCLYILKFSFRIVFVADLFRPSSTQSNGCAYRSIHQRTHHKDQSQRLPYELTQMRSMNERSEAMPFTLLALLFWVY